MRSPFARNVRGVEGAMGKRGARLVRPSRPWYVTNQVQHEKIGHMSIQEPIRLQFRRRDRGGFLRENSLRNQTKSFRKGVWKMDGSALHFKRRCHISHLLFDDPN